MAVSAAIALAGLGLAVYGAVQKDKAAKAAKANKMPEYKIPQEEYDNLRLAETYANRGISQQALNAYTQNADRALANTQSNILKAGGSANDIGAAQEKYQQGMQNLALHDDQARQAHLSTLMAQNARMGSFGDKSYQLNEYAPWANRAQGYAAQQQAGNQLIGQGLGMAVQGAGQFARSQQSTGDGIPRYKQQLTPDNGRVPFADAPAYGTDAGKMLALNYGLDTTGNNGQWGWNGLVPVNNNTQESHNVTYQPFYAPQPSTVDIGDNGRWGSGSQWGWNYE